LESVRTTAVTTLSQDDILATTSVDELARRFEQLGYPVDAVPDDPIAYGLAGIVSLREMWRIVDISGRLRVYAFVLNALDPGTVHLIASRLQSRFPQLRLLLVFTSDWRRLAFVNVRRVYEAYDRVTVKVHRVTIDRTAPTRPDLDLMNALRCTSDDPLEVFARQCEAFNVDKVTERFYKQYAQLFRRFLEALRPQEASIVHEVRRLTGRAEDLHAFTIRLLGRVMFLYFLQRKGWLAGESRFLENRYRECQEDGRLFYNEVLEPLFFKYLASRDGAQSPWGRIPYLNGGLFVREYPPDLIISLPNSLFDTDVNRPLENRGLLGFFAGYNFTVEEDTPLDVQVALDPELLGKVFENLLEEKQRGRTGTFYTPRPIVNYICRESLVHHLEETCGVARQRLLALMDEERWAEAALSKEEARALHDATLALRVLDPAVGTGAFLVGMMQYMIQVIRACRHRLGDDLHPGTPAMADLKRLIIRDCLFGVDIEPEAIELAQLRLWLSLVLDLNPSEDPDPLPNLDFELMVGNSLIDSVDGVSLAPEGSRAREQLRMTLDESDARLRRIAELKREFYAVAELPPLQREELRQRIRAEEMAELQRFWGERAAECMKRVDELGQRQAEQSGHLSRAETVELARQTARGQIYQRAADAVASGDHTTRPFVYELEFADIFEERGGFDIVFANPPYVSVQSSSNLPYRQELERRFREIVNGRERGWVDDLYVHFVFRAFELARPSGVVCYITSDTYFTIQSKRRMRELLHGRDLRIVAPCDPFKATVDAAVFLAFNRRRPDEPECEFNQMRYVPDEDFDRLSEEPPWAEGATVTVDSTSYRVREWIDGELRRYRFDPRPWLDTQRMAIWEPSQRNCTLYERLILPAEPLLHQCWEKIKTSQDYRKNRAEIEAYLRTLKPGDITLVGLVADGGQGLATANNGRFLAYREDSPEGREARRRRHAHIQKWEQDRVFGPAWHRCLQKAGNEMDGIDLLRAEVRDEKKLGLGKGQIYKTVQPEQCIESDELEALSEEQLDDIRYHGIADPVRHWVPFRKGDPEGRRWWADIPLYIDWSQTAVRWLYANSGKDAPSMPVVRNPHLYFRPGVTWSRTGNHTTIKARLQPAAVFDADSPTFVSQAEPLAAARLLGILNAPATSYVWKHFLNNTNKYEVGDVRELPLEVPSSGALLAVEQFVRAAVARVAGASDEAELDAALGLAYLAPFDEL
jgi:hypothetical protein